MGVVEAEKAGLDHAQPSSSGGAVGTGHANLDLWFWDSGSGDRDLGRGRSSRSSRPSFEKRLGHV